MKQYPLDGKISIEYGSCVKSDRLGEPSMRQYIIKNWDELVAQKVVKYEPISGKIGHYSFAHDPSAEFATVVMSVLPWSGAISINWRLFTIVSGDHKTRYLPGIYASVDVYSDAGGNIIVGLTDVPTRIENECCDLIETLCEYEPTRINPVMMTYCALNASLFKRNSGRRSEKYISDFGYIYTCPTYSDEPLDEFSPYINQMKHRLTRFNGKEVFTELPEQNYIDGKPVTDWDYFLCFRFKRYGDVVYNLETGDIARADGKADPALYALIND